MQKHNSRTAKDLEHQNHPLFREGKCKVSGCKTVPNLRSKGVAATTAALPRRKERNTKGRPF